MKFNESFSHDEHDGDRQGKGSVRDARLQNQRRVVPFGSRSLNAIRDIHPNVRRAVDNSVIQDCGAGTG